MTGELEVRIGKNYKMSDKREYVKLDKKCAKMNRAILEQDLPLNG